MEDIKYKLTNWYRQNKRDLPWRTTSEPYPIWLSEVIMQQTRVEQGMSYYQRFMDRFPNIYDLANASEDKVFKLWQGLGYYNRAANMMEAARTIVKNYEGKFPESKEELMKIKGIGPYTAAAIASIAFNRKEAVVDGNVFRVLSRLFGIHSAVNTQRARKEFEELARDLMDDHPPGEFNQALMEFGALCCKPRNPDCAGCIFKTDCYAYNNNMVTEFPVKKGRTQVRDRYFYYLVIESESNGKNYLLLKKRSNEDIWRNLYDFPLIEKNTKTAPLDILDDPSTISLFGNTQVKVLNISIEYRHQLTHQRIYAWFLRLIVDKKLHFPHHNSVLLVEQNKVINYPVPRLIERYLKEQALI